MINQKVDSEVLMLHQDLGERISNGPGTFLIEQGRVDNCILCHKEAAETDYLFSKEVLNAAKE